MNSVGDTHLISAKSLFQQMLKHQKSVKSVVFCFLINRR